MCNAICAREFRLDFGLSMIGNASVHNAQRREAKLQQWYFTSDYVYPVHFTSECITQYIRVYLVLVSVCVCPFHFDANNFPKHRMKMQKKKTKLIPRNEFNYTHYR